MYTTWVNQATILVHEQRQDIVSRHKPIVYEEHPVRSWTWKVKRVA